MGRKKIYFTEEERKQRKREYNQKYRSTEKGKDRQKEANERYQQTENYKNYKREYYLKNYKI